MAPLEKDCRACKRTFGCCQATVPAECRLSEHCRLSCDNWRDSGHVIGGEWHIGHCASVGTEHELYALANGAGGSACRMEAR